MNYCLLLRVSVTSNTPSTPAGAHKAALSLPFLSWTGKKNYDDRVLGQDKDGEGSLTISVMGKTDSDSTWGN